MSAVASGESDTSDVELKEPHSTYARKWMKHYNELKEFKSINGHCRVPGKFSSNPALGHWVSTNRTYYKLLKEGKPSFLTPERLQALEDINFEWRVRDDHYITWWERYVELKEFKSRHGHCNVPHKFIPNLSLGNWVATNRASYKKLEEGKPSFLTPARIRALEAIDFEWRINKGVNIEWWEHYEALKQFKSIYGHCRVPHNFKESPSLGHWVTKNRSHYKKMKKGKTSFLTPERVQALNRIKFEWFLRKSKWLQKETS
eukprot:CAMPEP_0172491092 /NCGR_PEP_ID=MMETSP1066-20121228/21782_1 /TAXON_ID=671091 /ORGANISM="Coscinodiscus wailesii, Strain CCMP2513" /LENGTH=258 /DNA_ID=CAMNT_0013259941 /DNA_START=90 /DNA_END=866 /DNA_ORIENTATION=-